MRKKYCFYAKQVCCLVFMLMSLALFSGPASAGHSMYVAGGALNGCPKGSGFPGAIPAQCRFDSVRGMEIPLNIYWDCVYSQRARISIEKLTPGSASAEFNYSHEFFNKLIAKNSYNGLDKWGGAARTGVMIDGNYSPGIYRFRVNVQEEKWSVWPFKGSCQGMNDYRWFEIYEPKPAEFKMVVTSSINSKDSRITPASGVTTAVSLAYRANGTVTFSPQITKNNDLNELQTCELSLSPKGSVNTKVNYTRTNNNSFVINARDIPRNAPYTVSMSCAFKGNNIVKSSAPQNPVSLIRENPDFGKTLLKWNDQSGRLNQYSYSRGGATASYRIQGDPNASYTPDYCTLSYSNNAGNLNLPGTLKADTSASFRLRDVKNTVSGSGSCGASGQVTIQATCAALEQNKLGQGEFTKNMGSICLERLHPSLLGTNEGDFNLASTDNSPIRPGAQTSINVSAGVTTPRPNVTFTLARIEKSSITGCPGGFRQNTSSKECIADAEDGTPSKSGTLLLKADGGLKRTTHGSVSLWASNQDYDKHGSTSAKTYNFMIKPEITIDPSIAKVGLGDTKLEAPVFRKDRQLILNIPYTLNTKGTNGTLDKLLVTLPEQALKKSGVPVVKVGSTAVSVNAGWTGSGAQTNVLAGKVDYSDGQKIILELPVQVISEGIADEQMQLSSIKVDAQYLTGLSGDRIYPKENQADIKNADAVGALNVDLNFGAPLIDAKAAFELEVSKEAMLLNEQNPAYDLQIKFSSPKNINGAAVAVNLPPELVRKTNGNIVWSQAGNENKHNQWTHKGTVVSNMKLVKNTEYRLTVPVMLRDVKQKPLKTKIEVSIFQNSAPAEKDHIDQDHLDRVVLIGSELQTTREVTVEEQAELFLKGLNPNQQALNGPKTFIFKVGIENAKGSDSVTLNDGNTTFTLSAGQTMGNVVYFKGPVTLPTALNYTPVLKVMRGGKELLNTSLAGIEGRPDLSCGNNSSERETCTLSWLRASVPHSNDANGSGLLSIKLLKDAKQFKVNSNHVLAHSEAFVVFGSVIPEWSDMRTFPPHDQSAPKLNINTLNEKSKDFNTTSLFLNGVLPQDGKFHFAVWPEEEEVAY
ncbi:hypothetical protein [Pseudomonas chlororaphis]|nr:hypothetical protein [Pseudomonas chlororaphis]